MVGDAPLREIVSAYLGGAVAGADHGLAARGDVVDVLLVLAVVDERAQARQGAFLVLRLVSRLGALDEYLLGLPNMTLGLPLTVAALTATAIMLVIVYCTKMYIPPAGALTILSMIIPSERVLLYPLQILVGTAVIMLISRLLFVKRQN